ncbi:MAG: ABC transporter ATP-binding protein [Bacteroidota bacterium]
MPLLEVNNLTTEFSSEGITTKAVDGISFCVEKGKILGIVGESGSGKSVTSLSIMRLIPSPQGRISNGQVILSLPDGSTTDLLSLPEKEMRRFRGKEVSMIFQEPMTSLNPVYKCGRQVAEAIMLHQHASKQKAKEITLQWFAEVLLPDPVKAYNSYPHELSGGQKQRVMIAMAMSCRPSVLIADEPTTALDVTVQKSILELMKRLQQRFGMSIIFITHDLGVIAEIADTVLVMYHGKIVEQGIAREVFRNPKHPYTKGLLACRPPLDRRLKTLLTVGDFLKSSNSEDSGNTVLPKEQLITAEERTVNHKKLYAEKPILQVKNLRKHFKIRGGLFAKNDQYFKAVDDVSFEVYPGETLGLVGESGCGKTTLGRAILRLSEPDGGSIVFRGTDITMLGSKELRALRKDIQLIFQDPYSSLNPRISIGSAIYEPMEVHRLYGSPKARRNKTIELLERVGLNETHYNRYPHEFSGGQRQRVCIARALAVDPKFIICDESVSALDVSVQAQVLNLLNELKKNFGFTYIFISHDLSVVRFMADRMMVMKDGKIVEMADADAICSNPQTDYTRKLISAIPKGN